MIYLIDANNLAGKMGILREQDFDKTLINIVRNFFKADNNQIFLVFDSIDPLGDRFDDDGVEVIYAPKNEVYNEADEKVIEIAKSLKDKEFTLITDDAEIIKEVKKFSKSVILKSSLDTAARIEKKQRREEFEREDEKIDSGIDEDGLARELLQEWKR